MKEKTTIKEWSEEDKPREKLLLKGISALTDVELIAILLRSGNNNMNAVDLARKIMKDNSSSLYNLGKLSINDLMKYKGVGQAKAVSIVAALELGKRRSYSDTIKQEAINSPDDVFNYIYPIIGDLRYEEFWVIFLNKANKIIKKHKIGQGGISNTAVDIRLIMKNALDNFAVGIILCHNHPSGNIKPSNKDIDLTNKIQKAANILQINLLDHIIVGSKKFFSFKDKNII